MQYVAVRPPPGPRSAGFNPAAAGGRYDRRQPAVSDYGRRQGLISSDLASAEHQGPTPFRRPLDDQLTNGPISLERGAIFQHKAVLSYLTCTYSCHVASKLPSRWLKIATWAQLGPTWPHLGSQEAPKRLPRGPQEVPRSHIFTIKIIILRGRVLFLYHTKLRAICLR